MIFQEATKENGAASTIASFMRKRALTPAQDRFSVSASPGDPGPSASQPSYSEYDFMGGSPVSPASLVSCSSASATSSVSGPSASDTAAGLPRRQPQSQPKKSVNLVTFLDS